MPEGPEVYIITQELRHRLDAKRFQKVFCKGKNIFIITGQIVYHCHLGLTGRWIYNESPDILKHETAQLDAGKGVYAHFVDPRKIGFFKQITTQEMNTAVSELGPDVRTITFEDLVRCISTKQRSMIGAALLDQRLLSGIGNYLRSEVLYYARIDPRRKIASFDSKDYKHLYKAITYVYSKVIESGGEVEYTGGTYVPRIHGQETDKKGRKIVMEKISGRFMYWVPEVQH
jgi:formamidopyrimidine-DNA glycosylase